MQRKLADSVPLFNPSMEPAKMPKVAFRVFSQTYNAGVQGKISSCVLQSCNVLSNIILQNTSNFLVKLGS